MGYKVKLNIFEGPFDLLVYLIEHAQMSIYDIKIAEITDQYVSYIDEMKTAEVMVAAEFMVLAAALIEIKSKMLLPRSMADQDDLIAEDPRTELVEKLIEYKRFKLLAEILEQQEERDGRIFEKPQEDTSQYTGQPDEYLDLELKQFVTAFNLFLRRKKKVEEIQRHHRRSEKQRITAEHRIAAIAAFFKEHPDDEVNFKELVENKNDKYDIAVTFSSILEMMKSRQLIAAQQFTYGDIFVWANGEGVRNDQ